MADISAKKRIWGWWWFDWASQPYHTLLVTFVFGPFFAVAAAAFFIGTGLDEKTADAEAQALRTERDRLTAEIASLQNKTRRLSDDYLDLDLLDQQAREVLGLVRGDEIVLR